MAPHRVHWLLVAALSLVPAACGGDQSASPSSGPTGTTVVATPVAATNDEPVHASTPPAIVEELLARFSSPQAGIVAARLVRVPSGFLSGPDNPLTGREPWLRVVVARDPGNTVDEVLTEWRAAIMVGAITQEFTLRGLPSLVGYTVRTRAPDGTEAFQGATRVDDVPDTFDDTPQEEIAARIRASAADHGLTLRSVEFAGPRPIPIVTIDATGDPQTFLLRHLDSLVRDALGGDPARYEGYAVLVDDAAGVLQWAGAGSRRTGLGSGYVAPDIVCEGLQPGWGMDIGVKPCPPVAAS